MRGSPSGTTELLVGKVHEAQATEDFQEYWSFQNYDPILYAGTQAGSFKTYQPRSAK